MSKYDDILEFLRSQGECPAVGDEPPTAPPEIPDDYSDAPILRRGDAIKKAIPLDEDLEDIDGPLDFDAPNLPPLELDEDWYERDREIEGWIENTASSAATRQAIEAAAWYQPISFFGDTAGIYIRASGARGLAAVIRRNGRMRISATSAFSSAVALLKNHELFHHLVEADAIRQHINTGVPRYRRYWRSVYQPEFAPHLTDDLLEEGLATAHMARALAGRRGNQRQSAIASIASEAFIRSIDDRPPGYRTGKGYIDDGDFAAALLRLTRSVNSGRLWGPIDAGTPLDSRLGPEITRGWHKTRTWWVEDDSTIVPFGLFFAIDDRRLQRYLRRRGFVPTGNGAGSHTMWRNSDGLTVNLPHRKDQSGYKVLRGISKELGMTLDELKQAVNSRS